MHLEPQDPAVGEAITTNPILKKKTQRGLAALRRVLRGLRWNDQGGYPGYRGRGKWDFVSTGLPQTTPEDLNALFALANIKPDVIISRGDCKHCANSKNGREQGYSTRACFSCKKPRMSNFRRKR